MRWTGIVIALLSATAAGAEPPAPATGPSAQIGRIDHPPIRESSGLVASRRQPGVFWTHNDSGNPPAIYAIDRTGKLLGEWRIGAINHDWEDIALDDHGHLYIGDIGNNQRNRPEIQVYQVAEPKIDQPADQPLPVIRSWRLRYPGGQRFDAEALFVHGGHGYLISKDLTGQPARLASFPLEGEGNVRVLTDRGPLPVRAPVTGADISADGRWLAIITVAGPRAFEIDGDLEKVNEARSLSALFLHPNMEAVTVVEEGLMATTERRQVLLFTWAQLGEGADAAKAE